MTQPLNAPPSANLQMKKSSSSKSTNNREWPYWGTLVNMHDAFDVHKLLNYKDYNSLERRFTSPKFIIGRADHTLTPQQMKDYREKSLTEGLADSLMEQMSSGNRREKLSATSTSSEKSTRERLEDIQKFRRYVLAAHPNLKIENSHVSGVHCVLQVINKTPVILDASTNGLFINGTRVPPNQLVKIYRGDRIQFPSPPPPSTTETTTTTTASSSSSGQQPVQFLETYIFLPKFDSNPLTSQVKAEHCLDRQPKGSSSASASSPLVSQGTSGATATIKEPLFMTASREAEKYHQRVGTASASTGTTANGSIVTTSGDQQNTIGTRTTSVASSSSFSSRFSERMIKVGEGGTSVVYVAMDKITGCKVAIKEIFKPQHLQMNRASSLAAFETREYRQQQQQQQQQQHHSNTQNSDVALRTTDSATTTNDQSTSSPFLRENTANEADLEADREVKTRNKKKNNNRDDDDDSLSCSSFSSSSSSSTDADVPPRNNDDDDFFDGFARNHPERKKVLDQQAIERNQQQQQQQQQQQASSANLQSQKSDASLPTPNSTQSTRAGSPTGGNNSNSNSRSKREEYELYKQNRRAARRIKRNIRQHGTNGNNTNGADAALQEEQEDLSRQEQQQHQKPRAVVNLSEINVLLKLRNPRIAQLIDFEDHPDRWRIIMEYVQGGSLDDLIRSFGAMSESSIRVYMIEILLGMDYLHRKMNVVHGDLKPRNILVAANGDEGIVRMKIADFGTSYQLAKKSHETAVKKDNNNNDNGDDEDLLGAPVEVQAFTPLYMAPEMARGKSKATKESDVWALGCIAYEMAAGLLPWQRDFPDLFTPESFYHESFPIRLVHAIGTSNTHPSLEVLFKIETNPDFTLWSEVYAKDYNEVMEEVTRMFPHSEEERRAYLDREVFPKGRIIEPPPEYVVGNTPLVSPHLIDFILQCWNMDPSKRPTVTDLLNHPCLVGEAFTIDDLKKEKMAQLRKMREAELENEAEALSDDDDGANRRNKNGNNGKNDSQQSQQIQLSLYIASQQSNNSSLNKNVDDPMMMMRVNSDAAASEDSVSQPKNNPRMMMKWQLNNNNYFHNNDDEEEEEEVDEDAGSFGCRKKNNNNKRETSSSSDTGRFEQLSLTVQKPLEKQQTQYLNSNNNSQHQHVGLATDLNFASSSTQNNKNSNTNNTDSPPLTSTTSPNAKSSKTNINNNNDDDSQNHNNNNQFSSLSQLSLTAAGGNHNQPNSQGSMLRCHSQSLVPRGMKDDVKFLNEKAAQLNQTLSQQGLMDGIEPELQFERNIGNGDGLDERRRRGRREEEQEQDDDVSQNNNHLPTTTTAVGPRRPLPPESAEERARRVAQDFRGDAKSGLTHQFDQMMGLDEQ